MEGGDNVMNTKQAVVILLLVGGLIGIIWTDKWLVLEAKPLPYEVSTPSAPEILDDNYLNPCPGSIACGTLFMVYRTCSGKYISLRTGHLVTDGGLKGIGCGWTPDEVYAHDLMLIKKRYSQQMRTLHLLRQGSK